MSTRSIAVRKERKGRTDQRVRERADELAKQGMPYQMAMAVAHGRMELNEALERMARRDRVNVLMERHNLARALATQIVLGHADLDQVLARRRLQEHRNANRDRTSLRAGQPLVVALHDGRALRGQVVAVDPYSITFLAGEGAEPEEIHKLQVKYAYDPVDWKKTKKGIRQDRKATHEPLTPAVRPQDRYSCSDRRLFGYLDQSIEVLATLLDGDLLRGHVTWFSRYEFGLRLRSGAEVTVFRHSLKELGPTSS